MQKNFVLTGKHESGIVIFWNWSAHHHRIHHENLIPSVRELKHMSTIQHEMAQSIPVNLPRIGSKEKSLELWNSQVKAQILLRYREVI